MQWPLWPLRHAGRIIETTHRAGIAEISCYTIAEALQRVRFVRQECDLPKQLYYYCALLSGVDPSDGKLRSVEDADLVLLEPNSPIDTLFAQYALNRAKLLPLFHELATISDDAKKAGNVWFGEGLLGCNRNRIREAAEYLVPLLPGHVEDVELTADLLRGMYGHRRTGEQFIAGIGELKEMLNIPLGLVAYIHRFMPDGRPVPWPTDLLDMTYEASRRLNLPIFDPTAVVKTYGASRAVTKHGTYFEEFRPVIGEQIFQFCLEMLRRDPPVEIELSLPETIAASLATRSVENI